MKNILIESITQNLEISGATIRGNFAVGRCNIYSVKDDNCYWGVELVHTKWENGEEEIASKKGNPEILQLLRNRLRMVISKTNMPEYPDTKFVTLRKAVLSKNNNNDWANLYNLSLGELSEYVGGNSNKYFNKLGALRLDYKIDVFRQTGPSANQLVVIFPKNNTEVLVHAFIVTRVLPLIRYEKTILI